VVGAEVEAVEVPALVEARAGVEALVMAAEWALATQPVVAEATPSAEEASPHPGMAAAPGTVEVRATASELRDTGALPRVAAPGP